MMNPPLTGITVVAIEQAVAAPFATRQLADLGARVIKIERPDGGDFARSYDATVKGLSSYFVWLNRSKESLTLDLKRPEAAEVIERLLERADVFVQNLAPGAASRLGTSAAEIHARHPRLVVCDVSGYGSTGPYSQKKAYDLLVQSEIGLMSLTGTPETPSRVGISVADISAGMYAYSSILAALYARERTGNGALLEVSLFDSLAEWMSAPAYYTSYGGGTLPRSGPNHATIAPYGPFAAQGGDQVFLGIQNTREWTRFCADVLEQPALADDPRFRTNPLRIAHRGELHAEIARVFARLTASAILERLRAAEIASARMNSVSEFVNHPQLAARDRWMSVDSPAGPIRMLRPPVQMPGEPSASRIPALGEDTDTILRSLGIADDTIADWRKKGVI
jgi:crotonobetainyl-CoA:carnitine CoA-transferase CaiB-like acyl-CoA transferase